MIRKLFKFVYGIFRFIRETVINIFFILFVVTALISFSLLDDVVNNKKSDFNPEPSPLVLNLKGYLTDNRDAVDFQRVLKNEIYNKNSEQKISIFDLARVISKASFDENVTGLILDLDGLQGASFANLQFIGKEIQDFKKSKKPVIAVSQDFAQRQYYLASFADKIYLNEAGGVDLRGFATRGMYYKSLFDKLGVNAQIFRVGAYKSAVEPYLLDGMSKEARANNSLWLNQFWTDFIADIAKNRHLKPEQVFPEPAKFLQLFKEANGNYAEYALKQGLVDEVKNEQGIENLLKEKFGTTADGKLKAFLYNEYVAKIKDRFADVKGPKIAVVNVEGGIIDGFSNNEDSGSATITKQLRAVAEDKNVKGLILRVSSPGGSAYASELIRQEILNIKSKGIPVVVSMGGVAASGGYWISANADKIIAQRDTLTGSIGIYGVMFSLQNLGKKIGVSEDGIETSPFARNGILTDLTPEQKQLVQISIDSGYNQFLKIVSEGRKMPVDAVDKIAQGQVWSGSKALEIGLVDSIGDFRDAYDVLVNLIAERNKTEATNYPVQWFVEKRKTNFLDQLVQNLDIKLDLPFASNQLVQQVSQVDKVFNKFNDPKHQYLICTSCEIK